MYTNVRILYIVQLFVDLKQHKQITMEKPYTALHY